MTTSRTPRLAAVAVIVALATAGAAYAASKLKEGGRGTAVPAATPVSSASGADSFAAPRFGGRGGFGFRGGRGHGADDLEAAASYLGLTEDALRTQLQSGKTLAQVADATSGKSAAGLVDALVAEEQSELAQAVKDGRITQAQADALAQNLKQRVTDRVNGTGFGRGPAGPGFGHGHGPAPGDGLAAAATYLGISQDALVTQLRAGKTLAQIADATSGKSKAGLVAALVAQEKSELTRAVQDGRLSQAQADRLSAALEQRVTDMVEGTFPSHRGDPGWAPPAGGTPVQPQHI